MPPAVTPSGPDTGVAHARRPDAVSRDDVLGTAMDLLREGGAAALSMRRLATLLGVSTQVVYSRVGGKADIARALHDRGFEALGTRAATLGQTSDTRADVHEVAQFYLDHATADPMRFALMFGRPIEEFERDERAHEVEVACFSATWVASVRAHLDASDPDRQRGTAVRVAWRLWSAVHGITTVHLAGHLAPDGDPEAELHAVVDLLLDAAT